ncbi:MAG: glycoside hydrolase family 88 protein [Bacteroides sp.]|nr:glycoside hydrolase family 88 protein [Bacteroides sp.]
MKTKKLWAGLGLCLLASCMASESELDVDKELDYCDNQVNRTLTELRGAEGGSIDYTLAPRNIMDSLDTWHCRKTTKDEWCNGFWPGILWYDYEATGDEKIKAEAEKFTAPLEFLSRTPAFDHDLGFLVFCSYGNGYRLTHNPAYKQVILNTADTLATLFNPRVGTILSWPRNVQMYGGHNTIMDNMINLEMLLWASKNGGDPRLADIAISHADKTMKYQFRPDYTSYHVAVYDTLTGEFIKGVTHQGYADNTMWARGQAWAIYGYTMMYRETKADRYLDFAQKVADVYLNRLPADYVPYWDFEAPGIPNAPRDASAAAVVASALLELSTYLPAKKGGTKYKEAAIRMLISLSSDTYQSRNSKPSFLMHSTGHWPGKSEIDASIIYADYYYIEALMRLKKLEEGKPIV